MRWDDARYFYEQLNSVEWLCSLTAPVADPSWCLWSITWPKCGQNDYYDPDSERGVLRAGVRVRADTLELARQTFEVIVAKFRANLTDASIEIERYNAALPYLICESIDCRLYS